MEVKYFDKKLLNNISPEAKIIFDIFRDQVRLVGGSTRDLLIGKKPKDDDFASVLSPLQIIEILQKNNLKAIVTNQKYGTISTVINDKNIEITTLRFDSNQKGRVCAVDFIDDYALDASRRDFSINAIYLDHCGYFYDYFQGIDDLKNYKICFIGDPNIRIQEDYLRILRFFRFSCEYATEFDCKGLEACIENKEGLKILSIERVIKEIFLLLSSNNHLKIIEALEIYKKNNILSNVIENKFCLDQLNYFFKNIKYFSGFDDNLKIRIALTFSDVILGNFIKFKEFFRKLKLSNEYYNYFLAIRNFVEFFDNDCLSNDLEAFGNINFQFNDLDKILKNFYFYLNYDKKTFLFDALIFYIINNNLPIISFQKIVKIIKDFNLPVFPLNGEDLLSLNFKGKQISIAMDLAKKHWIENNFNSSKSQLINYLHNLKIW